MSRVRLISWNVNGIRACYKKDLPGFVQSSEVDILCLQETKAHLEQVEAPVRDLGFSHAEWSSAHRKGYSGVATFSKVKPQQTHKGIDMPVYDNEGRIVISEFSHFKLYNIYFPNGGSGEERHHFKQQFLKDLYLHLKPQVQNNVPIVLVGDYNIAHKTEDVYDPVRLSKESGFLPEERDWMSQFFDLGFIDTFRHFHADEKNRYSWWSYRELARISNRGWRIDYISITKNLLPYLKSADIWDQIHGSDHCPVVADFEFGTSEMKKEEL